MVAWGSAKPLQTENSVGERREIKRMDLSKGDVKIRLLGNVLPRHVYWVVKKDGKKYPLECLRFNRDTQLWTDEQDPFKEIDPEIYSEKPQFAYVCNVIDRADNQNYILDLKATIYKQIISLASDPDYGDPSHPETGYDLTIVREKTGPLPQNVKYTIRPARSSKPLTEEEKGLELYNLDKIFKRMTYDEQKKWLLENTGYFAGASGDEFRPGESVKELD